MTAQMEEVWSRYPGAITEIWFDGGENNVAMNDLIKRLQPQAIAADGTAPPNFARLVGAESGFAPYPVWSTAKAAATDGSGDPSGLVFCPAEADTPVAENDAWFWKPGQAYRPLQELQSVYKNTVGANSLLELGVLPDNTGNIPADQMSVLQGLGDYIRACHSPEAAVAATNGTGASLTLTFSTPQYINRVIIQEDLSQGQLVQAFSIQALSTSGYSRKPILVATGTAIGHKRILYFMSGPILTSGLTITADTLYPGFTEANWRNFAAYTPCTLEQ
jgi:alpha-L-fucosidase